MARPVRGSSSRPSRNWGIVSGVTFATKPSGVTISKNNIDLTAGYVLPYATADGMIMTSGQLNCSGGSIARQALGLSAIYNVIQSPSLKGAVSAVTGVAVVARPEGGVGFGSTCTQVTFVPYKLNRAGVTFTAAVSIHYYAIGTA